MLPLRKKDSLHEDIEAVFEECHQSIREAVVQYQKEIDDALTDLKKDLTGERLFFS